MCGVVYIMSERWRGGGGEGGGAGLIRCAYDENIMSSVQEDHDAC